MFPLKQYIQNPGDIPFYQLVNEKNPDHGLLLQFPYNIP